MTYHSIVTKVFDDILELFLLYNFCDSWYDKLRRNQKFFNDLMPLHFVYRVYFVSLSRHCAKHRVACQLTFTSISLLDDSPQLEKIEWTWHEILRKTQSELMFNSMDSATNCTRFKPLLESQYYCLERHFIWLPQLRSLSTNKRIHWDPIQVK